MKNGTVQNYEQLDDAMPKLRKKHNMKTEWKRTTDRAKNGGSSHQTMNQSGGIDDSDICRN